MTIDPSLPKVAESIAKELFQSMKGVAAWSFGKFQAEFGIGVDTYIKRNRAKCGSVKTLLHRIQPIPLERAYVEPALKIATQSIAGRDFPSKLAELRNVVVVGNGGSGKSMFLKKLFLELSEFPFGQIPFYIELRDLNSLEDKDLIQFMYKQWSDLIPSLRVEALEEGLRSGKFILLLDGLDEVNRQERDQCAKNIVQFGWQVLCRKNRHSQDKRINRT